MYEAILERLKELIRYDYGQGDVEYWFQDDQHPHGLRDGEIDNIPAFLARNMAEVANEYTWQNSRAADE
jgi:hypothetical protein